MAHFYLVDGEFPGVGGIAELTGAEAKHAAVVSRVRVGEKLSFGDGRGAVGQGVVEAVSAQSVSLRVEARVDQSRRSPAITLVQALAKGDRDELAIQAATELGIDRIVPWQAARSVTRWDAVKAGKGVERWRSIVREAAKQSMRAWLPEVDDLVTTQQIAERIRSTLTLVLEPTASTAFADAVTAGEAVEQIVLVVGPEGGVAPEELDRLLEAGAVPVRLGPEVLRTSTAGPAALAVLSVLTGRWS